MYDLSWLNPTPHAIAVYATQSLSPVTTQHSHPSGRYSLLGPDLHRLDRTSLRLAHSFDLLAPGLNQRVRYCEKRRDALAHQSREKCIDFALIAGGEDLDAQSHGMCGVLQDFCVGRGVGITRVGQRGDHAGIGQEIVQES